MRTALSRIVHEWISDPASASSVPALLAGIPGDPTDVPPVPVALFAAEHLDDWLIEGREPPDTPCLAVVAGSSPAVSSFGANQPPTVAEGVEVMVLYFMRASAGAAGLRDARWTLRAVRQSLALLHSAPQTARRRNSIELVRITTILDEPVGLSIGAAALAGAITATCLVRDLAPLP